MHYKKLIIKKIVLIYLKAYLWNQNESVVSWLAQQMDENGVVEPDSFLGRNIASLQKDSFFSNMKNSVLVSFLFYLYLITLVLHTNPVTI